MNRLTLLIAAGLAFVPTSAGSETLNVSRLIFRVTAGNGSFFASTPVPQAVLIPYCGDVDGCKVSLKIADGYSFEAASSHLYLNEVEPLQWLSEDSSEAGMHVDADGNIDSALSLWNGLSNCGLSDVDPGSPDESVGFSFGLAPGPGLIATCTLVIED